MFRLIRVLSAVIIWSLGLYLTLEYVQMIGVLKRDHPYFAPLVVYGLVTNLILFYGISTYLIPKLMTHLKLRKAIYILIFGYLGYCILESILDYYFIKPGYSSVLVLEIFYSNLIINLAFVIAGLFYGFASGWYQNEKQKKELQDENLRAELDFLKAQVNPHFLFNVLNMAYSSATKSNDQATAEIISELASLMRYMLYESNVPKIHVEKEIEYIESYVELQKKRLSSESLPSITFEKEINGSAYYTIAPMLLIPFVENAFKHGIRMGKETFIQVKLQIEDGLLTFIVKNSVNRKSESPDRIGGIGLTNVKKRLELLYPSKYDLVIDTDTELFSVLLKINLL